MCKSMFTYLLENSNNIQYIAEFHPEEHADLIVSQWKCCEAIRIFSFLHATDKPFSTFNEETIFIVRPIYK